MAWTEAEVALASQLGIDDDRIEEVSKRLDLRAPNREALESLVLEVAQHYRADSKNPPFECVLDSATGVGKTFIMAAAIEYFAAADAVRNFVVVAPGRTILEKTIANFTPGHRKSLLGSMESRPVLVTADNFATAATRAAIDDDTQTKLYVFTVQSLTAPTSKTGRKTHEFHEGLGEGFYDHLAGLEDLVVFADEHHCYMGPAFSKAVRGLVPYAIVGLTATPHDSTPDDHVIFRYPLAAAIADRWVKTPVIVGRKDDRTDAETKLSDTVQLLDIKQKYLDAYCAENGLAPVNPVALVVAQNTAEADEYEAILTSSGFEGGRWADKVLTVHSNLTGDKKEVALAELNAVDDPESPVRIIISVGMLKEGWDVKNVYVIASMRASVSKVLTEQTLGRGLRLPFGAHTGIEILDTVEVLAHERYADLLKKANVLNEQFIDRRTRAVLRQNADGDAVVVSENEDVTTPVLDTDTAGQTDASPTNMGTTEADTGTVTGTDVAAVAEAAGGVAVVALEDRFEAGTLFADDEDPVDLEPRSDVTVKVPQLRMTKVDAAFKLADIVDLAPFEQLGRNIRNTPETDLRRMVVSAKVITGRDGLRRTELVTRTATDKLDASTRLFPLEQLREELVDAVLAAPVVPNRADQAKQVNPIINAVIDGLGDEAEKLLSAFGDRIASRLVQLVTDEHRKALAEPKFEEVIETIPVGGVRRLTRPVSEDRFGKFSRSIAYGGYKRSLYGTDWFDSSTERAFANLVDAADDVTVWIRLLTGQLPILWSSDGRNYNADFIVVEGDTHWIAEVKADKDLKATDVQAKRKAAQRWMNYVNASDDVTGTWKYLLASETDLSDAKGSWKALNALGS